ncbi:MAG: hypothetical protein IIV74_04075 [Alphaproteobacteria bacterium]|nr:hypothetical protein [Alphaproteobacteria bacterium]
MNFKWTLSYVIAGAGLLASPVVGSGNNTTNKSTPEKKTELRTDSTIKLDTVATTPRVLSCASQGKDVLYKYNNGQVSKRSGGTRAWRNCNPGNLRLTPFSRENGAIGTAGGFAVFPNVETGRRALKNLLHSENYYNKTIRAAIYKYAPPHENNVSSYNRQLVKLTGLDINKKISSLNATQLESVINAICVIEGWREGKETVCVQANKNARNEILLAQAQMRSR